MRFFNHFKSLALFNVLAMGALLNACAPQQKNTGSVVFKLNEGQGFSSLNSGSFSFPKNLCYFVNSTGSSITKSLSQNATCETDHGYGIIAGTVDYGADLEVKVPFGETHFSVIGVDVPVGTSCSNIEITTSSTPYKFKKFMIGSTEIASNKIYEFLSGDAQIESGVNTVSLTPIAKDSNVSFSDGQFFLKKDRSSPPAGCNANGPSVVTFADGAAYTFANTQLLSGSFSAILASIPCPISTLAGLARW